MKFDIETSLGILSVVSVLTCVGCTKESDNAKVQVVPAKAAAQMVDKHPDLVFSPKGSGEVKSKTSHASHSSHVSHSSHGSSRY